MNKPFQIVTRACGPQLASPFSKLKGKEGLDERAAGPHYEETISPARAVGREESLRYIDVYKGTWSKSIRCANHLRLMGSERSNSHVSRAGRFQTVRKAGLWPAVSTLSIAFSKLKAT